MGRRVLIADDDRDTRESIAALLAAKGCEALTAGSAAQALKVADTLHPHLVLLDIGLPDTDGAELCRRMRAEPWCEQVVIIAVSGRGDDKTRREAIDSGCDDYLVKPLTLADLLGLLSRRRIGPLASKPLGP